MYRSDELKNEVDKWMNSYQKSNKMYIIDSDDKYDYEIQEET